MRQVWITRVGPPEVLELREAPDPAPMPGEVQIRVRASGINFADIMARLGLYPDSPKLPAVVGYEVAGDISAVGAGVTRAARFPLAEAPAVHHYIQDRKNIGKVVLVP